MKWLVLLFVLLGCGVSKYSANTTARYEVCDPNGVCTKFYYDSETEKEIVIEWVTEGKVLKLHVKTGTSDQAIAAALSSNAKFAEIIERLVKMGAAGAMKGMSAPVDEAPTSMVRPVSDLNSRDEFLERVRKDSSELLKFRKSNPCPSTGSTTGACPGFVVDGDDMINMIWARR